MHLWRYSPCSFLLTLALICCGSKGFAAGNENPGAASGAEGADADPVADTASQIYENQSAIEIKAQQSRIKAKEKKSQGAVTDLTSLGQLAAFNDIAVISKKYLAKGKRFEVFPNVGFVMNNAFFLDTVLSLRFGYYFRDTLGLEANFENIGFAEKQATKDLREKQRVVTSTLVNPQGYYGLDLKWLPVYGKMAVFNKSIVPFDMYFLLGGGVTPTNKATMPPTFHLATGQLYALSKNMGLRWEAGFFWYKTTTGDTDSFMDMQITMGMSFFFPGAKYR